MCRGASQWVSGPDAAAKEIGLNPALSGVKTEDEGLYTVQHRYWLETMQRAVATEEARQAAGIEHPVCGHQHACDHA
jgi:benzoate/toluate 1,2-dioxygenase alpha subunit